MKFKLFRPSTYVVGVAGGATGETRETERTCNSANAITALRHQEFEFKQLINEMENYEGGELTSQEEQQKANYIKYLENMNKEGGYVNIEFFVENEFSDDARFMKAFDDRYNNSYILICVLVTTVVEGIINTFISEMCIEKGIESRFDEFQFESLLNKWTITPKTFFDNYEFDKGKALYSSLKELIKHRNSIIHCTGTVTLNKKKVINSSFVARESTEREILFLKRSISLPKRLTEHLINYMEKEKRKNFLLSCGYNHEIHTFNT